LLVNQEMTKITENQKLGEIGETEVLRRLTRFGWLGESIRKDFGEDLCFQSFLNNARDHHRVYVQVKSFLKAPKQVKVSTNHARNWMGMADVFYIFVYVSDTNTVFWLPFQEFVNPADVFLGGKSSISFPSAAFLDIKREGVLQFVDWHARLDAAQRKYMTAVGQFSMYTRGQREERLGIAESYKLIALDSLRGFLRMLSLDMGAQKGRIVPKSDFATYVFDHAKEVSLGFPIFNPTGGYFEELCRMFDIRASEIGIDHTLLNEFAFLIRDHSVIYLMSLIKKYLEQNGHNVDFCPDLLDETAFDTIFPDLARH
jgi:hypothetical protein